MNITNESCKPIYESNVAIIHVSNVSHVKVQSAQSMGAPLQHNAGGITAVAQQWPSVVVVRAMSLLSADPGLESHKGLVVL